VLLNSFLTNHPNIFIFTLTTGLAHAKSSHHLRPGAVLQSSPPLNLLSDHRTHFFEIVNRFPHAILCFTDRFSLDRRAELVFSIVDKIHKFRHRHSVFVFNFRSPPMHIENHLSPLFILITGPSNNLRLTTFCLGPLKIEFTPAFLPPCTYSTCFLKHNFFLSQVHGFPVIVGYPATEVVL